MSKQILVLPGDGIGPEIMSEAVKVLQLANEKYALGFELSYDELGGAAIDKYGVPLADETLERARAADAILLGAVGGPKWDTIDPAIRPERGLLKIRSQLGLFGNLRPALLYPQLAGASSLIATSQATSTRSVALTSRVSRWLVSRDTSSSASSRRRS